MIAQDKIINELDTLIRCAAAGLVGGGRDSDVAYFQAFLHTLEVLKISPDELPVSNEPDWMKHVDSCEIIKDSWDALIKKSKQW